MQRDEHDEPPYEGRAGRTRREVVHFTTSAGARSVALTRVANLATDPQLRQPLVEGTLHAREGAEGLASAVIVHDPASRRVVILLPEAIRHHELAERRSWLSELAEDHESALPRYAAEPLVAVGHAELAALLASPRRALGGAAVAELARREEAITSREADVAQREHRLRERAEHLTRREDEVREGVEETDAARRDLAMRESELEARVLALVERERALVERERLVVEAAPLPEEGTSRRELRDAPAEPRRESARPPAALGSRPPPRPIVALLAEDEGARAEDDVEELEELEPVATSPGEKGAALDRELGASPVAAPLAEARVALAPSNEAPVELVGDDELEEEVDDEMIEAGDVTGLHHHAEAAEEEDAAALVEDAEELGPSHTTLLAESEGLEGPIPASVRDRELGFELDEGVVLYARTTGERLAGYGVAEGAVPALELLIQLPAADADASLRSIVLVTLLDARRERLARAALDPRAPAERALLEALRRKYEARVVLHDGSSVLAEASVASSRELNVARVLEVAGRARGGGPAPALDRERALALALPSPEAHVLAGEGLERAKDARALREIVLAIGEAITPERLEDAVVHASVPEDAIEQTIARAIERAVAEGLALPPRLVERAVAIGVAADVGELISRQLAAFKDASRRPDTALTPELIAENWERLLASATDAELALDSETHELAYDMIRRVRGATPSVPPGSEQDPSRVTSAGIPELLLMLDHPRYRRAAALELASRAGAEHVEALCKAARKMPRAEVVRVVPAIARIGEEAGDGLIDGLSAKKTFVRHAFTIALGHLKLRRALVPLLHLLREEESPAWRDIARVVGSFGNASLRPVLRQASDGKLDDERAIVALAHLANHGADDALLELTKDRDAQSARLAVHALAGRERAREWEDRVLGRLPVDDSDPVQVFARRFQEELDGKAPERDLDEES